MKISRFVKINNVPKNMQYLLSAIKEIENIIPKMELNIEFAVNKKGEVIIFQVRPLTTGREYKIDDPEIKNKIDSLKNNLGQLSKKRPHIVGDRTILADMPDWNPAEIIGDNPNYLDYSLYDYIITDSAWHEARTSQGYYNVNPSKLVTMIGNKPYIDVRSSFNSFIPGSLPQNLREKLVSFYLNKLENNPELQDKVEFEVLYTCYDLYFEERSKELLEANFSKEDVNELKNALINLTNNLVINSKDSIPEDLSHLKDMERNREKITKNLSSFSSSVPSLLSNAKFLLKDCREKGTVQFSRLARLGFVGKILLKSLINRGIIDNEFYDRFMNSISTVAKGISNDFKLLNSGKMRNEDFIKKYYHLRPGSYDITSLRYDSNPDLLKPLDLGLTNNISNNSFSMDKKIEENITVALKREGLKFDAKQLLEFIKTALEAREFSKFEFTKNLSDAIELIAMAGQEMGFTRQELAMLDVKDLFAEQIKNREELTKNWKGIMTSRKEERETNSKVELPPIIFSEKDFDIIHHYIPRPNYITNNKITTHLVNLNLFDKDNVPEIENKIVLIENGDPGYDWIFTRNIAGLITKYGGVASHMSIRCAEFGIPAAIGCGVLFDQLSDINSIILDCKSKRITPIRDS